MVDYSLRYVMLYGIKNVVDMFFNDHIMMILDIDNVLHIYYGNKNLFNVANWDYNITSIDIIIIRRIFH